MKRSLNLSTKTMTDTKRKLLCLIYDMPFWAESSYHYIYSFICHGMIEESKKFPMSKGHEEEVVGFCQAIKNQIAIQKAEKEAQKPKLTEEEKARKKASSDSFFKLSKFLLEIDDSQVYEAIYEKAVEIASEEKGAN